MSLAKNIMIQGTMSGAGKSILTAGLLRVLFGRQVDISLDYTDYGKIEYLIRDKGIPVLSSDFAEGVNVSVMTLDGEADDSSEEVKKESADSSKAQEQKPAK